MDVSLTEHCALTYITSVTEGIAQFCLSSLTDREVLLLHCCQAANNLLACLLEKAEADISSNLCRYIGFLQKCAVSSSSNKCLHTMHRVKWIEDTCNTRSITDTQADAFVTLVGQLQLLWAKWLSSVKHTGQAKRQPFLTNDLLHIYAMRRQLIGHDKLRASAAKANMHNSLDRTGRW